MKHHPEQRDDEIYLGNDSGGGFRNSAWITKRLGHTPLMADGSPFTHPTTLHPWFVQRSEVAAKIISHPDWADALQPMLDKGAAL